MLPSDFLLAYPIYEEVDTAIIASELELAELIFTNKITPNPVVLDKLKGLYVAHNLALDYNRQVNLALSVKGVETGDKGQDLIDPEKPTFYKDTIYGSKLLSLLRRVKGTAAFTGGLSV